MDDLELDTAQQRYFQDLFLCCESEGKVPALKATELFRSANLSNEHIRQVIFVCYNFFIKYRSWAEKV